jgi:phage-related protein
VGERYVKHIEGHLVEVRGSGTPYRILAGLLPRRRLVLLHGVEKKTDKLPRRDIETAKRRLEEVEAGVEDE